MDGANVQEIEGGSVPLFKPCAFGKLQRKTPNQIPGGVPSSRKHPRSYGPVLPEHYRLAKCFLEARFRLPGVCHLAGFMGTFKLMQIAPNQGVTG